MDRHTCGWQWGCISPQENPNVLSLTTEGIPLHQKSHKVNQGLYIEQETAKYDQIC